MQLSESDTTWRRLGRRIAIAAFAVVLSLPLAVSLVDVANGPDSARDEHRAKTPTIPHNFRELKAFPGDFKWYFMRRFGLRDWLIGLHGRFKVDLLGVSSSDRVVIGRDGWLYTAGDGALDDYRGLTPLTPDQLDRMVAELVARRDWLLERGIAYVIAISPDKASVYPEHLPERYRRIASTNRRLDQLLAKIASSTDLEVVDFRPILRSARDSVRLYHRTDTHWNEVGAYLAARELVGRLHDQFPELPIPDTSIPPVASRFSHGGDLSRQLAVQSDWEEELVAPAVPRPELIEEGADFVPLPVHDVLGPDRVVIESPGGVLDKVVVMRDSFGVALMPWLSPYFRTTVFILDYGLPRKTIESEAPVLVIQQLVERKIPMLLETAEFIPK
jgi:hypothetical protein